MSELHYLHGVPTATGVIKANPEDFVVIEDLGYPYDGEGEQLLVRIRKIGCNTRFVAEAIAKFLGVPVRDLSYAGMKDRHAVTERMKGRRRMGWLVSLRHALAMAGASGGTPGSPMPLGSAGELMTVTATLGISPMRSEW